MSLPMAGSLRRHRNILPNIGVRGSSQFPDGIEFHLPLPPPHTSLSF